MEIWLPFLILLLALLGLMYRELRRIRQALEHSREHLKMINQRPAHTRL